MNGNVDEWSKLYTLFKLLSEGKLYAADANVERIPGVYYDVLKAIRQQSDGHWEYVRKGQIEVVKAETGEVMCSVPIEDFTRQADILLAEMKKGGGGKRSFDAPQVWDFAQSVGCNTLKAKSEDKADIRLMVHSAFSPRDEIFGFSIKSRLGSPSTLLNASAKTNFTYEVKGHALSTDEIARFDEQRHFRDKFEYLHSLGARLSFVGVDSETFNFNLKMVSCDMPELLAAILRLYYEGRARNVSELTEIVAKASRIRTLDNMTLFRHRMKELLSTIALGMMPGTRWTGDYEATGGYIIVREDGDVVCYHLYNQNAFKNYLFLNTCFDTPSKSRHKFGSIYTEDGRQYLKLNAQIRFVK